MSDIVSAIVFGTLFGFALNRVGATNPHYIMSMVRLSDLHLMKTILFAVGFASALLFLGMAVGIIDPGHLSVKTAHLGVLLGGAILGVGFAIAGFCPGTGLGAAATGRIDAMVFVLGGLLGAFLYTIAHKFVSATGLLNDLWGGKVTLAATANDKFGYLINILPGPVTAVILAGILMSVALVLPKAFAKISG